MNWYQNQTQEPIFIPMPLQSSGGEKTQPEDKEKTMIELENIQKILELAISKQGQVIDPQFIEELSMRLRVISNGIVMMYDRNSQWQKTSKTLEARNNEKKEPETIEIQCS